MDIKIGCQSQSPEPDCSASFLEISDESSIFDRELVRRKFKENAESPDERITIIQNRTTLQPLRNRFIALIQYSISKVTSRKPEYFDYTRVFQVSRNSFAASEFIPKQYFRINPSI